MKPTIFSIYGFSGKRSEHVSLTYLELQLKPNLVLIQATVSPDGFTARKMYAIGLVVIGLACQFFIHVEG